MRHGSAEESGGAPQHIDELGTAGQLGARLLEAARLAAVLHARALRESSQPSALDPSCHRRGDQRARRGAERGPVRHLPAAGLLLPERPTR
jgi:hypothetical protein